MYLPLAAIVAIAVCGLHRRAVRAGRRLQARGDRRGSAIGLRVATAIVVAVFAVMTDARNRDYHSVEGIWLDTVEKRPMNARARVNYASALVERHRYHDAEEHLRRLAERRSPGAECRIQHGESASRTLRRFLETRHPALTVMAPHGREWIPQLLLGSVAAATLNAACGPLLLVREPDHGVALPYRRILVPTDMSEPSRRAFPMAGLLARTFGAEVILLHVARAPQGDPAFGTSGVTYEVEFQVPSETTLEGFAGDALQGVRVSPRVLMGSAWSAIMDTATIERADLIVLSTHGLDSMADRLIGSHAERIVRHAPCPVLIA